MDTEILQLIDRLAFTFLEMIKEYNDLTYNIDLKLDLTKSQEKLLKLHYSFNQPEKVDYNYFVSYQAVDYSKWDMTLPSEVFTFNDRYTFEFAGAKRVRHTYDTRFGEYYKSLTKRERRRWLQELDKQNNDYWKIRFVRWS